MSRATGATYGAFFPSAPRAGKDKAKVKIHLSDSPSISAIAEAHATPATAHVDAGSLHGPPQSNTSRSDVVPQPADDNESIQGDLLNGVGSASSHTSSSVSSVFSAPTQQANMLNFGGPRNNNAFTPLTNTDSSPNRAPSPNLHKADTQAIAASGFGTDHNTAQNVTAFAHNAIAQQTPSSPRIYARDPNMSVKGEICTYDPLLDPKLSDREKKKKPLKPIYKEFGMVRTYNLLRGRHLVS